MFLVIGLTYIFHHYKLVTQIDENGHSNRNIDSEIKRQKAIEQKLICKFIRIDPEKEDFNIFRTINKIFRQTKQSSKNILINNKYMVLPDCR